MAELFDGIKEEKRHPACVITVQHDKHHMLSIGGTCNGAMRLPLHTRREIEVGVRNLGPGEYLFTVDGEPVIPDEIPDGLSAKEFPAMNTHEMLYAIRNAEEKGTE